MERSVQAAEKAPRRFDLLDCGTGSLRRPWLPRVFLVYQPAWQGGLLWDDTEHVTRPELRSWHGLYRIWVDVGATPQYYPLVHSVFWVEHKLWGDATLGYHLVNIFLHATAALLAALILRRLAIPGAYLAAAIFALHPVQVESVAWITEMKNTLSAVFYLGAAMLYLRFDQTRKTALVSRRPWDCSCWPWRARRVTATLPGALLVIFWWQRGRLSWKKDVLPLAPFFLLGAGMGMITAWWELEINKCVGPEFEFTRVQRILIAGRGVWFHLGKLFWPANLTFIYPRWQIDPGAWRQYLFPLAAAALLAVAWAIRQRTRAPLAAMLFFGGTLFPVMGFFNLYTFRFSFIADHYQYLASLGIITLFSAGAALLLEPREGLEEGARTGGLRGPGGRAGPPELATKLDVRRCRDALSNDDRSEPRVLAGPQQSRACAGRAGQANEAIDHFRKALDIKPDNAEVHNNLGMVLADCGQFDEAVSHYQEALDLKPDNAEVHNNLGNVLARRGQFDAALGRYRTALEINPAYAQAHNNRGARSGRTGALRRGHRRLPGGPGNQSRLCRSPQQPGRRVGRTRAVRRGHRPLPHGPGNQSRQRKGPLQPGPRFGRPGASRCSRRALPGGPGNCRATRQRCPGRNHPGQDSAR